MVCSFILPQGLQLMFTNVSICLQISCLLNVAVCGHAVCVPALQQGTQKRHGISTPRDFQDLARQCFGCSDLLLAEILLPTGDQTI